MIPLSQIAMKFSDEPELQESMQSVQPVREDQPVNVGVRLKKLKSADTAEIADVSPELKISERFPEAKFSETAAESTNSEASPEAKHSETFPEAKTLMPFSETGASITFAEEKNVEFIDSDKLMVADRIEVSGPEEIPKELNPTESSIVEIPVEVLTAAPSFVKIKSGRGRKSIRQISEEADLIQIPEDEILFQKHYYTMGEVAEMFRVNQSLLRFWEAEFSILQPKKNKKGDRYFRPDDIKNLHLIYHLLRQRKYTIEGAKDFLKKNSQAEEKFESIKKLEEVKRFLLEMRANLR